MFTNISYIFIIFQCWHIPPIPVDFFCRWSIRKLPGVGRRWPAHIRYFFFCSSTPQDPPAETGPQRYTQPVCAVCHCLSVFYVLLSSSLDQKRTRITESACQLRLCEESQRSQAVSLASPTQHYRTRGGHMTLVTPLCCHHQRSPAAKLTGEHDSRTFRDNFLDD